MHQPVVQQARDAEPMLVQCFAMDQHYGNIEKNKLNIAASLMDCDRAGKNPTSNFVFLENVKKVPD